MIILTTNVSWFEFNKLSLTTEFKTKQFLEFDIETLNDKLTAFKMELEHAKSYLEILDYKFSNIIKNPIVDYNEWNY